MGKGSDAIEIHGKDRPWSNNGNIIWLASSISLHRNIDKFSFPGKLDLSQRKQIISLISNDLLKDESLHEPILLKIEEMSPIEKELFTEHFLIPYNLQQHHSGEALMVDNRGIFLANFNLENHVQLILIDTHGELESSLSQLVKIEIALGKKINYAFSPRFGFLTANPAHSGTGLVLSVYLQPSALIHTNLFKETMERLSNDRLCFSGIQGDKDGFVGDVVIITNNYSQGISEEEIIANLRLFTTKLIVEESSARSRLKENKNVELMDKVSRAYGILVNSYNTETLETLNEIGLVKLGVDLGWIEGTTPMELNRLFFHIRRAHLLTDLKDPSIPQEQIPHKRAEIVHQTLKNATLRI